MPSNLKGGWYRLPAQARRDAQGLEAGEPAAAVFERRMEAEDNRLWPEQHARGQRQSQTQRKSWTLRHPASASPFRAAYLTYLLGLLSAPLAQANHDLGWILWFLKVDATPMSCSTYIQLVFASSLPERGR